MKSWTRKEFLKQSLAMGSVALLGTRSLASMSDADAPRPRASSPNGDVRVAVIGLRGKGGGLLNQLGRISGVTVAALCDVDESVLARRMAKLAEEGKKPATHRDFRRVLDDPSIDAVVLATPNHWHALMAVMACQAGKDVYVEKPASHNVWEGRKIIEAAQRYGRIVEVGTQSRSDPALHEAFAWLREGNLGKIEWARGLCYKAREPIGRTSGPQPIPADLDYDLWTGPAPLVPSRRNSPTYGPVHYDWHWFWNYGGGDIANQGAHEIDMCRWALGEDGLPPSVMSFGGRFGPADDAETPNTQVAVFNYEKAPLIFEVRGLPAKAGMRAMDAYRGIRIGLVVQCEGGYFAGGAAGGGIYDPAGKKIRSFSSQGGGGHMANFIDTVRSRKVADLAAPVAGGHLSSSLSHIANISYRLGVETPFAELRERLAGNEVGSDSLARLLPHLEANEVRTDTQTVVAGPTLQLAAGAEHFVSTSAYDPGYWANTLLRDTYRAPFIMPEKV